MILLTLLSALAHGAWDPPDAAAEAFNRGVLALEAADPTAAEAAFRAALEVDPDCGRCAHGLGLSLVRQQRLADAEQVLAQAAATWPERAELHTALTGVAFATQDFDAALAHARRATSLDAASVDAQVGLNQVLLRLGRTDEARLGLAAASLPGPERACLAILIAVEEGASPGGTQVAYCRQARHPGLASTVEARLAARQGQLSAAAAAAGQGGATTVQQVATALRLHQQGRDGQALPLLDEALQREPRRVDARILRALARARTGDQEGALTDLQQVFDARAWVQVHDSGEMSGVLTATDERALADSVRQGAGLLVSLLVQAQRLDDARAALEQARSQLGDGVELSAGAVRLAAAGGDTAQAWRLLTDGLARWPGDSDLTLLAADLAARDPDGVPPAVAELLRDSGDWRAAYHLAVGAARQGDHAGCTERAAAAAAAMDRSAPAPTSDDRLTVRRLWHTCAVNAEHATEAERAATALGEAGAMNEVARINHALMRHQAGDDEGALHLLEGLRPTTEARRELAEAISVRAAAALDTCGLLDEALQEACRAERDSAYQP